MTKTSLLLVIALLGCEAATVQPAPAPEPSKQTLERAPAKADDIKWNDTIEWRTWDDAQSLAHTQHKSICVVVYADWCPRCKELAPEFAKPEVASAAKDLIMVRQDQDDSAPWLKERLGKYGDYVPRVLFLDPNGEVREDLNSGHPRYAHFYAPLITDRLVSNMRAASRR